MKISIITVCYNSARTLEKTILSVYNQSYRDIEYILIDGNSSDNTADIVKKHFTKIDKFISEPDKGLYDAMNKGIALSTGDLVGILNSDDFYSSNSVIQEVVDFHSSRDIDASIGDIIQCNESGSIRRFYSSKNWNPDKLCIGFMPPHPSVFFRRVLFEDFGNYNTSFKIAADFELISRFFKRRKISWMYSGITTTIMLDGGLSRSGLKSYILITQEIGEALLMNKIAFSKINIRLRFLWKIFEFSKK
jgi:glycosyltransferase involved in cell wall biosynthesis